jgi:hypothetical protein
MDLFIRYFFPIEMEYINDLIQKVIIKDKWNAISYDDTNLRFDLKAGHSSIQTRIQGIDWRKFWLTLKDRRSIATPISKPGTTVLTPNVDEYNNMMDLPYVEPICIPQSRVPLEDKFEAKVIQGLLPRVTVRQRSSTCFNTRGTKKYLVEVLNATIN